MTEITKKAQTEALTNSVCFTDLGISDRLLRAIEIQKFTTPTPIQSRVIPIALKGADVVGIAQTGTGKTLAFGIPLMEKVMSAPNSQALVICPTRELAAQVEEMMLKVGQAVGLRTVVLIGGAPIRFQIRQISRMPHVIIATPGRLMDHMNQRNISLKNVNCVVLDEADRMLDIGFMPQIKQILAQAPTERQTLLFSATMPPAIAEIANKFMKNPVKIEVAPQGTTADKVEQEMFIVHRDDKTRLLEKILTDTTGSVLVFSRTKHGAKKLSKNVQNMGQAAIEMHSDRTFAQRKNALEGFKSGKYRVLVATDVAARGIDVNNIAIVINYDLPDDLSDYIHRIGRTARAGKTGKAISFVCPDQRFQIKQIERLIRKQVLISALPVLPPKREAPMQSFFERSTESRFSRGSIQRGGFSNYQRSAPSYGRAPAQRNNFSSFQRTDARVERTPVKKMGYLAESHTARSADDRQVRTPGRKTNQFVKKASSFPKKFFNKQKMYA